MEVRIHGPEIDFDNVYTVTLTFEYDVSSGHITTLGHGQQLYKISRSYIDSEE